MIVAIDGPASSGKSTTARTAAERLGLLYLDTGAMYRAAALAFLRAGCAPTASAAEALLPDVRVGITHDEGGDLRVLLDGEDVTERLRTPDVGTMASQVSALKDVREKLVEEQRRIAAEWSDRDGGVILDGRDIGTVVFPDADVKFFLIADAAVRARRRLQELEARGTETSFEEVHAEIRRRDAQDRSRETSPLKKADDAIALDTTDLSIDEQVEAVVQRVRTRRSGERDGGAAG